MKKIFSNPARIFRLIFFLPFYLFFPGGKRRTGIICLLVMLLGLSSCFRNFYLSNTKKSFSDPGVMEALKDPNKYILVHFQDGTVYGLKNVRISNNNLEADIFKPEFEHLRYLNAAESSSLFYKKNDQYYVLNEVHLYAQNGKPDQEHLILPVNSISRIDIYQKDKVRTNTNHILSIVGVTLAGSAVIGLAAFLITCNCPQVYVQSSNGYEFKSGVFSGAIYSSMERTDYLPLGSIRDKDGVFNFRMMNNQQEQQFINEVQLAAVTHDPADKVLMDRHGNIHTCTTPSLTNAVDNAGRDVSYLLQYADGNNFEFDTKGKEQYSNIVLTASVPAKTKQVKLIVNAQNSAWSGFVFEQFSALFGKKYKAWEEKQDRANFAEQEQWLQKQSLPLMVYIQTKHGWQYADYFPMTGNTAAREMVMQVNLPADAAEPLNVKIETSFMFWDIDYAALDFVPDHQTKTEMLLPLITDNKIAEDKLARIDKEYAELKQNESVEIQFKKPLAEPAMQTDYFLLSTGYYHRITNYEGNAKLTELVKFRQEGSFDRFSRLKYNEIQVALAENKVSEKR